MTKPLTIPFDKVVEQMADLKTPAIFEDKFPEPIPFKNGAITINLKVVAKTLCIDHTWLLRWLNRHTFDDDGKAFYRVMGKAKLFTKGDYKRLCDALSKQCGIIYFAICGDFVKIGFSRSIEHRKKRYYTENPLPVIFVHQEQGTYETENLVHKRFSHLRVRREWFHKTQELLDYIEERKRLLADQEQAP
jgi:hypothetical protein